MLTVVELEGVNGERWTLAGPDAGDRGVYLATDVKGLYEPPVKVVYEEPGNYPGARYLSHRILRRDITFAVEILNDRSAGSWMSRDSEWRKAWAFDEDCTLYITTEESGTRYLKLRLGESPEVSLFTDPNENVINATVMVCIAGDPFWYEDDVVYEAQTVTDTRFDPSGFGWPWPYASLPKETLYITVDPEDGKGGLNPTDNIIFPKWTVPGSTEKPAQPYVPGLPWLGAPASKAAIWTIPDYSFEDEEFANRRLRLPGLIGGLRTREIQSYVIDGRPSGGTYKLGMENLSGVVEWTAPIAWNANTSTVKAALESLSRIAYGDVDVTRGVSKNEIQSFTIGGSYTGGTYTITFDGQTTAGIKPNTGADGIRTALAKLPNLDYWDIDVKVQSHNEVQYVYLVGEPTSGSFRLSFDGQQTADIAWNASAKTVADRLKALSNIGSSDVKVTKKAGSYQPWKIEFIGGLSGIDLMPLEYSLGSLSGGYGIDINVKSENDGDREVTVKFNSPYWFGGGRYAGDNLPPLVIGTSGLTGGTGATATVKVDQDGGKPYLIEFKGNLEGENLPLIQVDASAVTGPGGTGTAQTATLREGVTYPGENAVIDTDPRVEQISSENGAPLWARMNGVRFRNYIPPYTRDKTFEITVSGCPPGEMVTLRLPRAWTRPWGLE